MLSIIVHGFLWVLCTNILLFCLCIFIMFAASGKLNGKEKGGGSHFNQSYIVVVHKFCNLFYFYRGQTFIKTLGLVLSTAATAQIFFAATLHVVT